jgi:hypothetical protein
MCRAGPMSLDRCFRAPINSGKEGDRVGRIDRCAIHIATLRVRDKDGIDFASEFRTEVINPSGQFISNVRRRDVAGQYLSAMILDGVVVDQVKMLSPMINLTWGGRTGSVPALQAERWN